MRCGQQSGTPGLHRDTRAARRRGDARRGPARGGRPHAVQRTPLENLSKDCALSQQFLSNRAHTRPMHNGNPEQGPTGGDPPVRALVVEDDAGTAEFVRVGLAYEGFDVAFCADGAAAVRVAERMRPDVVVLDWMLPNMDGLDVCRRLRLQGDAAILMLTARDGLADRVLALDCGADDYLVKPFHYEELVARIRAVLRRRGSRSGQALQFADLRMDPST